MFHYNLDILSITESWLITDILEAVGIKIRTGNGPIYVMSVYIPPNAKVTMDHWLQLFDSIPREEKVIIMGHVPEEHDRECIGFDHHISGAQRRIGLLDLRRYKR